MSSSVTRAVSTSRRSHQQPATMRAFGPVGPPRTQGSKPPGNSFARARGKAPERSGAPRPRLAALDVPR
eukprot:9237492-Alexandrium_andersonii.AAC.1